MTSCRSLLRITHSPMLWILLSCVRCMVTRAECAERLGYGVEPHRRVSGRRYGSSGASGTAHGCGLALPNRRQRTVRGLECPEAGVIERQLGLDIGNPVSRFSSSAVSYT